MMRLPKTHFVDFAAWAVLIPSLLICLSCVTPFPMENLEEGMTADAVRERFGEPRAMASEPEGTQSAWTYVDEELDLVQALVMLPLWPLSPVLFATSFIPSEKPWSKIYADFRGVSQSSQHVILLFEEDRVVRWEVTEPPQYAYSGYSGPNMHQQWQHQQQQQQWQQQQQQKVRDMRQQMRDIKHGHKNF